MNVFAEYSAFFAVPFLAEALDASLYVINTGYNNWFESATNVKGIYCGDHTEKINNDSITIVGYGALTKIKERIQKHQFERVNFIASDTFFCKNYKWCNMFIKENNIHFYAMPDLEKFCLIGYKPIYQYVILNTKLTFPKSSKLLVTHSPGRKYKSNLKGSNEIKKIVFDLQKKYDFDFKLLSGVSMDDVIREKSKSHIFIDQLVYKNTNIDQSYWGGKIKYDGGLGKSGLEAMALDTCVITSGIVPDTKPYFDSPPITWTSYQTFYEDLEELILNEGRRNNQIQSQNEWVKNVITNKQFYKEYLM